MKTLNRKEALRLMALGGAGALLTACGAEDALKRSAAADEAAAAAAKAQATEIARQGKLLDAQATTVANAGGRVSTVESTRAATAAAPVAPTEAAPATAVATRASVVAGVRSPENAVIPVFPDTADEFHRLVNVLCAAGCTDWKDRIVVVKNDQGEAVGFEVAPIRTGQNDVVSKYSIQNPWDLMQFGYMANAGERARLGLTLEETRQLGYQEKNVGAGIPGHWVGVAEGFAFYRNQSGDYGKLTRWTVEERSK